MNKSLSGKYLELLSEEEKEYLHSEQELVR